MMKAIGSSMLLAIGEVIRNSFLLQVHFMEYPLFWLKLKVSSKAATFPLILEKTSQERRKLSHRN